MNKSSNLMRLCVSINESKNLEPLKEGTKVKIKGDDTQYIAQGRTEMGHDNLPKHVLKSADGKKQYHADPDEME